MKIAIVGSRSISNYDLVCQYINDTIYIDKDKDVILSGGVKGVDSCAEQYAKENKIKFIKYAPNYDKYGDNARFIRNMDIIGLCDICICIWDGESDGTAHDIQLCNELSKECYIYNIKTNSKE